MWVKDVMDAYLDEMVGDVTAVENLDDWCYHGFYDYGLKVTEYIYGEAVSPNINDSQTVESILPDNEYVVSPSIYASNCPNLSAVEMLENVASWISQCPALSEHAGGYLYWQPGVEDWLSMYLPDNSLSADQVDTVLLYAGAAAQWDNAYQNGGYLDLSGNDPPTLSDPDVTDALNALTATGVDVYHD
jgi:hypothetical protein